MKAGPALVAQLFLLLAGPAFAGGPANPVTRPSAFLPNQTNVYDSTSGQRIAVIRDNPFIPGQQDVYSQPGNEPVLQIEPSPFLPGQLNVYDLIGHD